MALSRRELIAASVAASPAARLAAQTSRSRPAGGPVAVASANGLRGVELARKKMLEGDDPLDAAIAGVTIQELDPDDLGVGIGGLPNADGVVQLDASCMHGPTRRAGAVGALEGIAEAAAVAKEVMERTDHIFLVGEGARRFALDLGYETRDLLTKRSRDIWQRWRARLNPDDNWLSVAGEEEHTDGTINLCALTQHGDLSSVTTTSGLSWKIPGRVGDSPILGAGQYCDNEVGAAGSTGRGEANIMVCGAFSTVDEMRRGASPEEACLRTLERVLRMTEDRLLDDQGRPLYGVSFYAVSKSGEVGGATLYEPTTKQRERNEQAGTFAVADDQGARLQNMAYRYSAAERPEALGG